MGSIDRAAARVLLVSVEFAVVLLGCDSDPTIFPAIAHSHPPDAQASEAEDPDAQGTDDPPLDVTSGSTCDAPSEPTAQEFGQSLFWGNPNYQTLSAAELRDQSELVVIATIYDVREGPIDHEVASQISYSVVIEGVVQYPLKGSARTVSVEFARHIEYSQNAVLCQEIPDDEFLLYLTLKPQRLAGESPVYQLTGVQGIVVEGESRLVPAIDPVTDPFAGVATTFEELIEHFDD